MREDLPPGRFVLVDQFIDRTFARVKSFFGPGLVAHVLQANRELVRPQPGDAVGAALLAHQAAEHHLDGLVAGAFAGCWLAGWLTATGTGGWMQGDPAWREVALRELELLRLDFSDPRARTSCGLHRRIFSYAQRDDGAFLRDGFFAEAAALLASDMVASDMAATAADASSAERARYFVDPWGSAYWVRHGCNAARTHRTVYVYSFGPNRRRDSSRWVISGDDLGLFVKGSAFTEEPGFAE